MPRKDDNVRFVRIRGKVVPIRSKKSQKPAALATGREVSSATVSATAAAGSTTLGFSRFATRLEKRADRINRIADKYAKPLPEKPRSTIFPGSKGKRRKTLKPDIFEWSAYSKSMEKHSKRAKRLSYLKGEAGNLRKVSSQVRKMRGRAAAGVAVLAFGLTLANSKLQD